MGSCCSQNQRPRAYTLNPEALIQALDHQKLMQTTKLLSESPIFQNSLVFQRIPIHTSCVFPSRMTMRLRSCPIPRNIRFPEIYRSEDRFSRKDQRERLIAMLEENLKQSDLRINRTRNLTKNFCKEKNSRAKEETIQETSEENGGFDENTEGNYNVNTKIEECDERKIFSFDNNPSDLNDINQETYNNNLEMTKESGQPLLEGTNGLDQLFEINNGNYNNQNNNNQNNNNNNNNNETNCPEGKSNFLKTQKNNEIAQQNTPHNDPFKIFNERQKESKEKTAEQKRFDTNSTEKNNSSFRTQMNNKNEWKKYVTHNPKAKTMVNFKEYTEKKPSAEIMKTPSLNSPIPEKKRAPNNQNSNATFLKDAIQQSLQNEKNKRTPLKDSSYKKYVKQLKENPPISEKTTPIKTKTYSNKAHKKNNSVHNPNSLKQTPNRKEGESKTLIFKDPIKLISELKNSQRSSHIKTLHYSINELMKDSNASTGLSQIQAKNKLTPERMKPLFKDISLVYSHDRDTKSNGELNKIKTLSNKSSSFYSQLMKNNDSFTPERLKNPSVSQQKSKNSHNYLDDVYEFRVNDRVFDEISKENLSNFKGSEQKESLLLKENYEGTNVDNIYFNKHVFCPYATCENAHHKKGALSVYDLILKNIKPAKKKN